MKTYIFLSDFQYVDTNQRIQMYQTLETGLLA